MRRWSLGHYVFLFGTLPGLVLVVVMAGCSPKSQVPVGKPAENVRKLALAYVQFSGTNRGVGPTDQASLKKFMIGRSGLTEQEADALFVSPRDNQPYVILWGLHPEGSGPMGPTAPKPPVIIYEKDGADGTRYVADGHMQILELSEQDFSKAVPKP